MSKQKPKKQWVPNLLLPEQIGGFSKIMNECMLDKNIILEAKTVLAYITGRPPNWHLNIEDMAFQIGGPLHVVKKCMKNLIENDYLFKIQKRIGKKVISWGYVASMIPMNDEEIGEFMKKHGKGWILIKKNKEKIKEETPPDSEISTSTERTSSYSTSSPNTANKIDRKPRQIVSQKEIKSKDLINRQKIRNKLDEQKQKMILESTKAKKALIAKVDKKDALKVLFKKWYSNVLPETNRGKHYTELKSFQNAVTYINRAMRGTLFKNLSNNDPIFDGLPEMQTAKLSLEAIEECIDFHIQALQPEYEPKEKKFLRIHLDSFLYNPYNPTIKSYLLHWMTHDPIPVTPLDEVKDQELFDSLVEELNWQDKPNKEKNKLIYFINKNYHMFSTMKKRISPIFYRDKHCLAKAIIDGMKNSFLNKKGDMIIHPTLFKNDKLMDYIHESIMNTKWIM